MAALSVEQSAAAFALWHRAVAASLPPERLLVLDVFRMSDDELWRRLSEFVGRSTPARGTAFPHQEYGADV